MHIPLLLFPFVKLVLLLLTYGIDVSTIAHRPKSLIHSGVLVMFLSPFSCKGCPLGEFSVLLFVRMFLALVLTCSILIVGVLPSVPISLIGCIMPLS